MTTDRPPLLETASPGESSAAGPHQAEIRFGGDALILGEADRPALTPEELAGAVQGLLRENQGFSAKHLVQQFPDVAREVLLESAAGPVPLETLQAIADAHDEQCLRTDPGNGWRATIADRASRPDRYAEWDDRRRQMLTSLQYGNLEGALAMAITSTPAGVPSRVIDIEAWYLQGLACMLAEQNGEAVKSLDQAVRLAWDQHPYEAARLLLLLSEARRRSGDAQGATESWNLAVRLAIELASGRVPVSDPVLWERIAYLRPVDFTWPLAGSNGLDEVAAELGMSPNEPSTVIPASTPAQPAGLRRGEMLVWAAIGMWRLERGEFQTALVALKRAETNAVTARDASRLRLAEAKSLLAMDQPSAARAILLQLASSEDPLQAKPAMAVLGTMLLQQGATVQGHHLLQRAVEEEPAAYWGERPQAEADLGLSYLLTGNEQAGLRYLHNAQRQMETAGDWKQLLQSLENEASYFELQENKREAKSRRERAARLQAECSLSATVCRAM